MVLAPNPGDTEPPVVHSVTIDQQDVLTQPAVTLHIDATDNVSVTQMFIKEWDLATTPFPHWQEVQASGWILLPGRCPLDPGQPKRAAFRGGVGGRRGEEPLWADAPSD